MTSPAGTSGAGIDEGTNEVRGSEKVSLHKLLLNRVDHIVFDLDEVRSLHNWFEYRATDRSGSLNEADEMLDKLYWFGTKLDQQRICFPARHMELCADAIGEFDLQLLRPGEVEIMGSLSRVDRQKLTGLEVLNLRRQWLLGLGDDE